MTSKTLLRIGLVGGILICLLVTIASIIAYPAIATPPSEAVVYGVLLGVTFLGYILIAVLTTRSASPVVAFAARYSLQWGAFTGVFWLIEVLAGNLGDARQAGILVAYFGGSFIALGLPLIAALLSARSAGRAGTGIIAGLWSGMIGALITFFGLMALTYAFMGVMRVRSDNIAEFHRSGGTDIVTYLIGDALAGGIAHLLFIGVILSGILGVIGGFVGAALTSPDDGRRNTDDAMGSRINTENI